MNETFTLGPFNTTGFNCLGVNTCSYFEYTIYYNNMYRCSEDESTFWFRAGFLSNACVNFTDISSNNDLQSAYYKCTSDELQWKIYSTDNCTGDIYKKNSIYTDNCLEGNPTGEYMINHCPIMDNSMPKWILILIIAIGICCVVICCATAGWYFRKKTSNRGYVQFN